MTFKIFVTCDDDVRLSRRMLRDIKERGRDTEGVLYQFLLLKHYHEGLYQVKVGLIQNEVTG